MCGVDKNGAFSDAWLVGGFNPFSNWIISPSRVKIKQIFETTTYMGYGFFYKGGGENESSPAIRFDASGDLRKIQQILRDLFL